LLTTNAALGGGRFGLQPATWGWRWGETGSTWGEAFGLNNIGLLVRVFGKVAEAGGNWLTIDDGSGTPVKCILPWLAAVPVPGDCVTVTGICSCERHGDEIRPMIRVRSATDVTQL
jgi:hypothetical protein